MINRVILARRRFAIQITEIFIMGKIKISSMIPKAPNPNTFIATVETQRTTSRCVSRGLSGGQVASYILTCNLTASLSGDWQAPARTPPTPHVKRRCSYLSINNTAAVTGLNDFLTLSP